MAPTTASADLEVDIEDAIAAVNDLPADVRDGAKQAVRQITVLAESFYKAEAPEGAGADVHLRDTVTTEFSRRGLTGRVFARKTVGDGIPLAAIITGAADPSWTWEDPPPIPPLMLWANAKVGDPSFAFYLRWKLVEEGYDHDPFVDRAMNQFDHRVEDIAQNQMAEALRGWSR